MKLTYKTTGETRPPRQGEWFKSYRGFPERARFDFTEQAFEIMEEVIEASTDYIDIVFDGPPSHESGRFVEVENSSGASISYGDWVERDDGLWALRIPAPDAEQRDKVDEAKDAVIEALREQNDERCGNCKGREEGITFCERVECAMRPVVVALAALDEVRNVD